MLKIMKKVHMIGQNTPASCIAAFSWNYAKFVDRLSCWKEILFF
jgi:hypothetical protein